VDKTRVKKFMIDLDGNIYEARPINYPGDTNTEYDPTGHALIEVMGNYEVQTLSKKQLDSLINLIAFLAKEFNVPVSEIKTHRDYSKMTVCPGKNIYKYFQDSTIVKAVEKRLKK
ncbi:MAG: N-acetylmuramoyl-L-alanine amidase, partial [Chlorobi bacterium]|nr:N-acetylmuramoyl-L-alanine amidase [Chlorobiota bacterium]